MPSHHKGHQTRDLRSLRFRLVIPARLLGQLRSLCHRPSSWSRGPTAAGARPRWRASGREACPPPPPAPSAWPRLRVQTRSSGHTLDNSELLRAYKTSRTIIRGTWVCGGWMPLSNTNIWCQCQYSIGAEFASCTTKSKTYLMGPSVLALSLFSSICKFFAPIIKLQQQKTRPILKAVVGPSFKQCPVCSQYSWQWIPGAG